jgi:hypothetical protein
LTADARLQRRSEGGRQSHARLKARSLEFRADGHPLVERCAGWSNASRVRRGRTPGETASRRFRARSGRAYEPKNPVIGDRALAERATKSRVSQRNHPVCKLKASRPWKHFVGGDTSTDCISNCRSSVLSSERPARSSSRRRRH